MKGVILSGGHGTRLRPLTHNGPKQLIPIANKPNILYCIDDLREAGITDIAIILGDVMPEKVKALLEDGKKFGVNITYVNQGKPFGIAHAVGLCKDFVGNDSFVVYLGDNIIKGGIKKYVEKFKNSGDDANIMLCEVPNPQQFGVAELDGDKVVRLVEKPKEPKSNLALVGIYMLKPIIFDMVAQLKPSWRGEYEITEALDLLLKNKKKVSAQKIDGWWKDTGKPEDILAANHLVLEDITSEIKGELSEEAKVMGRVKIGEGSRILGKSFIRGPCIIGKNCIIENAYIGPHTSIGDGVAIKNAELESSIIMDEVNIDVDKKIADSLLGKGVKILNKNSLPRSYKFTLGELSHVEL